MADEWTINYLPADGGRLSGQLKDGSEEVRVVTLYDSSNKEILKWTSGSIGAFAASGGNVAYVRNTDTEFEVVLPRAETTSAVAAKKGMTKRVLITMSDGIEFQFDHSMPSTKNLVASLNS